MRRQGQEKSISLIITFIVIILVLAVTLAIIKKPKDIITSIDNCLDKGGHCSVVCGPGEDTLSTCSAIEYCCVDPERLVYGIDKDTPDYIQAQINAFEVAMINKAADDNGDSATKYLSMYKAGGLDPEFLPEKYQYKGYEGDVKQLRTLKRELAQAQGLISKECTSNLVGIEEAKLEDDPASGQPFYADCLLTTPGNADVAKQLLATAGGKDCSFGGWNKQDQRIAQFTCPGIMDDGDYEFACQLESPCTLQDERVRSASFTIALQPLTPKDSSLPSPDLGTDHLS